MYVACEEGSKEVAESCPPVEAHGREENGEVGLPGLWGREVHEEGTGGHRGSHTDLEAERERERGEIGGGREIEYLDRNNTFERGKGNLHTK